MSTIVVLGANGQVGAEVCLFLRNMSGVTVVPVVRSQLGATLLERCGLECRIGSLTSDRDSSRLLDGADLVVDFRLPSGLPTELRRTTVEGIEQCMTLLPARCPYVYISSTMAFGMDNTSVHPRYKWHTVARTSYATYKRHAERYARWCAFRCRRESYILRLGQVFGELQAVSRSWLRSAMSGPVAMPDAGSGLSDAVFCGTIALALRQIAAREEEPGTYTLVESPDWRWSDVYAFHAAQAGVSWKIEAISSSPRSASIVAPLRALAREILAHKEVLVAHLLPPTMMAQQFLKARHLTRLAAADIAACRPAEATPMVGYVGPVPGGRLKSLGNSWRAMQLPMQDVRRTLDEKLGPRSHNYHGSIEAPGSDRYHQSTNRSCGLAEV